MKGKTPLKTIAIGVAGSLLCGTSVRAQIDPTARELIQIGYNQALQGASPISAYAFYYHNKPGWLRTNMTLRLAVAPVFVDTELGFKSLLGENTDVGFGFSGGGYGDSYSEIRQGKFLKEESFDGHSAEVSASVYHLFNPDQLLPVHGIGRVAMHHSIYERTERTATAFSIPDDRTSFNVRTGIRVGGREPVIAPDVALELAVFYDGEFRTDAAPFGFAGDRDLSAQTHLFTARAQFVYTFPQMDQYVTLGLNLGTSIDADRLSAFRLGGLLPFVSEDPLNLPGYFFQEISARQYVLLNGSYSLPLGGDTGFSLTAHGSVGSIGYVRGMDQPGTFHAGVGGALGYRTKADFVRVFLSYSYGFEAIRTDGRGAHSIGLLAQIDLERSARMKRLLNDPMAPFRSRGLFRMFQ